MQHQSRFRHIAFLVLATIAFIFFPSTAADDEAAALYAKGLAAIEADDLVGARGFLSRALELRPAHKPYMFRLMTVETYLGYERLFAGDYAAAEAKFRVALELRKRETSVDDAVLQHLTRLVALAPERAAIGKVEPEYVYRYLLVYVMETDLEGVTTHAGTPVRCKGRLNDPDPLSQRVAFGLLKLYLECFTRGRLSVDYETVQAETVMKGAIRYAGSGTHTKFRPDFESCEPSLGPILFAKRNDYDTAVFYYNFSGVENWPYAGFMQIPYVPATWDSPVARGMIGMPMGSGKVARARMMEAFPLGWTTFHEFFHNVEGLLGGISPKHAWDKAQLAAAMKKYPDWEPGASSAWTAREYSWYRYQFQRNITPRLEARSAIDGIPAFAHVNFRLDRPDPTEPALFAAYAEALAGVPVRTLREAAAATRAADELLKKGDKEGARKKLLQAVDLVPAYHLALSKLGKAALDAGDRKAAADWYGRFAEAFPSPPSIQVIAQAFAGKGWQAEAGDFFLKGAAAAKDRGWWLREAWNAYMKAGDAARAAEVERELAADPRRGARLATLTAAGTKLGMYYAGGGGGTPTVWDAKRGVGSRWRIVPSARAGLVSLVSEVSWEALATRGRALRAEPLAGEEAQLWRIEIGPEGRARILSAGGLYLALFTDSGSKKSSIILATGAAPEGAILEWSIEDVAGK